MAFTYPVLNGADTLEPSKADSPREDDRSDEQSNNREDTDALKLFCKLQNKYTIQSSMSSRKKKISDKKASVYLYLEHT